MSREDRTPFFEEDSAIDKALQKCAEELKALAWIYQGRAHADWAKQAYKAFLQVSENETSAEEKNSMDKDASIRDDKID